MEFIDLAAEQSRIKSSLDQRIQTVLKHGKYINGPEVGELETALGNYVQAKHAVGCASGTDALLMALMAYGIGPGDAVFTTPFTFIATAEVISLLGATPIFVDIDPGTFNIDPEKLEAAIRDVSSPTPSIRFLRRSPMSLKPKGIIAVDLFGLTADFDRINEIARSHGLFVIEDAAQAFGADYKGRKSCSLGDIACTSFFPAKPLGCYGDGGMCFTDDDGLAELLRSIRVHGMGGDKYNNVRCGINGRLDTLQASILLAKFEIFQEAVELRQQAATKYREAIQAATDGEAALGLQHIPSGYRSVWAQFSILAPSQKHRSAIQNALKQAGIPSAIYYPKPLHLQQCMASLAHMEGDFPVTEDCAKRIFSIPMHPYLRPEDQDRVVQILSRACKF